MFKNLCPPAIGIQTGIRESLKVAKSAGFDGLDLDIDEASRLTKQHSIDYVRDLWAEFGLKMGGWEFPIDWKGGRCRISGWLEGIPNTGTARRRPRLPPHNDTGLQLEQCTV